MLVTHSAWVDLVIHGLAHLPIARQDASRLHDPGYAEWAAARLRGAERTLPLDPKTASQPFTTLAWADEPRARLARQMAEALPEALIDLFLRHHQEVEELRVGQRLGLVRPGPVLRPRTTVDCGAPGRRD
ncbi:MAG: hypothetical protein HY906_15395 [Deltaproteobacteria bacterium]|nr:hypothetical protein [Deltaproteobacteria bacterium]